MTQLKALRDDDLAKKRPTQADFDGMVRQRRREIRHITEQLARGDITPSDWADRFDSVLMTGHSRAWFLGRWLAGDSRDFNGDDELAGRAAKDLESEFISGFLDALRTKDPRYFDKNGNLRIEPVMNRGNIYLGKMRGTANDAFVEASDDDDFIDWLLGLAEHCDDCPRIAAGSPYTKATLWTKPAQGDTECLGFCECRLRRRSDGLTGFAREGGKGPETVKDESVRPVGEAVQVNAGYPVANHINHTIQLIDSVHTDGVLPETEYFATMADSSLGGWFDPKNTEIAINAFGQTPLLTTAHETGHLLDFHGIGKPGKMASPRSAVMKPWRDAVKKSKEFKHLQKLRNASGTITVRGTEIEIDEDFTKHVVYMLRWEELWARSYAQFIATQSADKAMLNELASLMGSSYQEIFNSQWNDQDFDLIAAAFVEVFKALGWME